MASAARTRDVLRAQIALLQTPYVLDDEWEDDEEPRQDDDNNGSGERGKQRQGGKQNLPKKVVEEALRRLNHARASALAHHFSPQAVAQLCEQLETLEREMIDEEWARQRDADGGRVRVGGKAEDGPGGGINRSWLSDLPVSWPTGDAEPDADLLAEYDDLRQRVTVLSAHQRRLTGQLEHYKQLQTLLASLDPAIVQPNMLTRDGPLAAELERSRLLVPRLLARLADYERRALRR